MIKNDLRLCTFTISNLDLTNIREMHIVEAFQKNWKYTKAVNKQYLIFKQKCGKYYFHIHFILIMDV